MRTELFFFVSLCLWLSSESSYNNVIDRLEPASDSDIRTRFDRFVKKYERTYEGEEVVERRFRIFRANLKKIQTLNKLEQGSAVYGVTQFADLTRKEFLEYYTGLKKPSNWSPAEHQKASVKPKPRPLNDHLPQDFDWRHYNAVTPVKNQGMCGSCWAFSVTGNVEGQWAIKHKKLLSFSEQELVDCDKMDNGCEGGYMYTGYQALEKLGGLELETDYPYEAYDEKCHFNISKVEAKISSSVNISSNETEMASWLYENGPISIALNAFAMQFYFGGVSHPFKFLCNPNDLDHGVLLAGYGIHQTRFTKKLIPYWLIKNSWGTFWGEHGYYRLYRGAGVCGVNQMASSAIVL